MPVPTQRDWDIELEVTDSVDRGGEAGGRGDGWGEGDWESGGRGEEGLERGREGCANHFIDTNIGITALAVGAMIVVVVNIKLLCYQTGNIKRTHVMSQREREIK